MIHHNKKTSLSNEICLVMTGLFFYSKGVFGVINLVHLVTITIGGLQI